MSSDNHALAEQWARDLETTLKERHPEYSFSVTLLQILSGDREPLTAAAFGVCFSAPDIPEQRFGVGVGEVELISPSSISRVVSERIREAELTLDIDFDLKH